MRLPRLAAAFAFAAAVLALCPLGSVRGDDTSDFLNPDNWVGRNDLWKFSGGSIIGETKEDPKYNTFLASKKTYSDFELTFKVQLREGIGNSGVQIRSMLKDEKKVIVAGPQVDIGQMYWGSLYGEGVGGMMRASSAKKVEMVVKQKEFNDYKIVAKGTRITVIVNGETMVDDDFPTLPAPKGKKEGAPAPTHGIIAFQVHQGFPSMRVEYKDIKFVNLGKK